MHSCERDWFVTDGTLAVIGHASVTVRTLSHSFHHLSYDVICGDCSVQADRVVMLLLLTKLKQYWDFVSYIEFYVVFLTTMTPAYIRRWQKNSMVEEQIWQLAGVFSTILFLQTYTTFFLGLGITKRQLLLSSFSTVTAGHHSRASCWMNFFTLEVMLDPL